MVKKAISRAPYRLTAMHAIELYLNALMLFDGLEPGRIRGLQHDFAARADHLIALKTGREYVVSRYGTDQFNKLSQINRLQATLDEIYSKVGKALERKQSVSITAPIALSAHP